MKPVKDNLIGLWTSARAFRDCLLEDSPCNLLPTVKKGALEDFWDSSLLDESDDKRWLWKDVFVKGIPDSEEDERVLCAFMTKAVQECDNCNGANEYPQGEVLARLLLPPTKEILFDKLFMKDIIWATYMLFDERAKEGRGEYIYRNLINLDPLDIDADILILMYRSPESGDVGLDSFFRDYCLDFSNTMRGEIQPDYALVCSKAVSDNDKLKNDLVTLFIGDIIGEPSKIEGGLFRTGGIKTLIERSRILRERLKSYISTENGRQLVKILARVKADKLSEHSKMELKKLDDLIREDIHGETVFFKSQAEIENESAINKVISAFSEQVEKILTIGIKDPKIQDRREKKIRDNFTQNNWRLANYFIWLAATHPDLDNYVVRHSFDFRRQSEGRRSLVRPSGIVIATRSPNYLKSMAARAEIIMHELLSPLTSFYAWDNLETSTKSLVLTDYAKGAAHGFKNALILPEWYLEGINQTLNLIIQTQQISAEAKNELIKINKDLDISYMLIEQLNKQAQLFFWVMAPDRYREEKKDDRQLNRWPENSCDLIMVSSFFTAMSIVLSTTPIDKFRSRNLVESAVTNLARNSIATVNTLLNLSKDSVPYLLLSSFVTDITSNIFQLKVHFEIDQELSNTIKLKSVSRGALEGILTELFQNAIRVVLTGEFNATIKFGISKENDIPFLYISNTSSKNDASKLRDAISTEKIDSYSASGGIRGLRQITAFERELMTDLPFEICRPEIQADEELPDYISVDWKIYLQKRP